jgi:hypothetical protein
MQIKILSHDLDHILNVGNKIIFGFIQKDEKNISIQRKER